MRKELYNKICERLSLIAADGSVIDPLDENRPERMFKYIDLWNHNVEFIEQEEGWGRPAVFVEFCPVRWNAIVNGVEYRAEPFVKLHIVTDWKGCSAADSEFKADTLEVFDLCDRIHKALCLMGGDTFKALDLVESQTNHNHEDILENIEVYQCVAFRKLR